MSLPTPFGNEPLTIREGEEISGGRVDLDGNFFVGCRIIGAEVYFSGGNWGAKDTRFDECRILFDGQARFMLETFTNLVGREAWTAYLDAAIANPVPKAN